ncbi:MAG: thermonuclease family protein [Thermodesulfovibrionales bacterium]|nr:thermonuclease family protein [Nitrospinota bacterium]MCG2709138.1 thermonuclease family protein [Thermodesulfovibrionales bacterium]
MHRRCLKTSTLFTILIAILLHSLCIYDNSLAFIKPANPGYVRVIKVHDGDTVTIVLNSRKEKVRLIGIDAPEIKQRPWGTKARKHLEKMLTASNRKVTLEFDVERRDKHGRPLCYIFTPDRKMLNIQMVKDGYAVLLTLPPNIKYVDELRIAQNEARQHRRGIWGSSGLKETPSEFRKKHPRNN